MFDRNKYIQHIQDENLRSLAVKILDKSEVVLRNHQVKHTDFLTPHEVKHMTSILNAFQEIKCVAMGGYEGAERKTLVLFQEYLDESYIDQPIAALQIEANTQFNQITHRDYLGAILGLGIKREKIGDILVQDDICQIVLHTEMRDYVLFNLNKVGNTTVKVKEIQLEELRPPEEAYKEIHGNVASLRLDAIVSVGFKLSRNEAQAFIQKQRCSVNWEIIDKPSYIVNCKDLISIRGKGRIIINGIDGTTRSGRTSIQLHKLI